MQFPKWQHPEGWVRPSETQQAAMGAEHCDYNGLGGRAPWLEQAGGRALRLGQTWEVAAWKIEHLGSCHLEKYPWKVATGEKSFGKVP